MAFWNKKKGPVMASKRKKPEPDSSMNDVNSAAPPGFVYDSATDRYVRAGSQDAVPRQPMQAGVPVTSFDFDEDAEDGSPPGSSSPAERSLSPDSPQDTPAPMRDSASRDSRPPNHGEPEPSFVPLRTDPLPERKTPEPVSQPQPTQAPGKKKRPSAPRGGREETEDTKDPFRPPTQATQTALALSWAASAASFRGFVIFLLSLCLTVVCLAFAVFVLVHQDVVFLSIDADARPTYITAEMGAVPSHETMVRDFIYNGFIGDTTTIKNNVERAQAMMTQTASALFYEKYWKALIENMSANGLVQTMVVQSIETVEMKPDKFTVKATCVRQYSKFNTRIQSSKSFLTLEIVKTGVYTKQNPWGMSIDGIEYTGE